MRKFGLLTIFSLGALLATWSPALADSCLTAGCHQAISAMKAQHEPVKGGECLSCHVKQSANHPTPGAKGFKLTATGAALCSQCHDPFGKKTVVHAPVKEGDCTSCHNPHGADGRYLINASDDQTGLCMSCHDSAMIKQKYMHGPAAVGACTKCHDPHESNTKGLIRGTVRESCLGCHTDFAASFKTAQVVHPPVQKDPCTLCHDPHGSAIPFMLAKKMPDLCIGCHSGLAKKLEAKVPHKPLLQDAGCGSCHSSHFAKAKGLLPFDELTTCLSCHDKDNLGKPALRNIKKELAGKKYLHGPVAKGECKACHDPHGSDNFRMLKGAYPAAMYVPYKEGMYDACLGCHEKNLLRFADTTIYTNFRNGNRNLHYVHVVNSRKGRSCRVCHDVHASDGQKLITKDGAKFGDWKIPLNFKMTETGGSCAPGCHRELSYDRKSAVSYK